MASACALESKTDLLERAFQLAYFIHLDRSIALTITIEALDGVETMGAVQKKRRYYRPIGRRPGGRAKRDRILLGRDHLLQQLIFCESEPFEREQEQSVGQGYPTDEDMAVRFIGFLVRIALRRNALHVAVGLGRFLYGLDTEKTARLYDLVVQDPERFCSVDYVRARKSVLLAEVERRFGPAIRVRSEIRGEKRIESRSPSERLVDLTIIALENFTPWGTECVVPPDFDPDFDQLSALVFARSNPDAEHRVEIRRIHALLHPMCFRRLSDARGFPEPMSNLALPRFYRELEGSDPGDSNDDRGEPMPALIPMEREMVEKTLRRRHGRRQRFRPGALTIRIDGRDAGNIGLGRAPRARFRVAEIERLEVLGEDAAGLLRLATWMPGPQDSSELATVFQTTTQLSRDTELRFAITRREGETEWNIDVELCPRKRVFGLLSLVGRIVRPATAPIRFSMVTLAALFSVALLVLEIRDLRGSRPAPVDPVSGPGTQEPPDLQRGSPPDSGLCLQGVESIFIWVASDVAPGHLLAAGMEEEMAATDSFRVDDSRSEVDAMLEIIVLEEARSLAGGEERARVRLRLVNRAGEILWSLEEQGTVQEIVQRARLDLVGARERAH